MSHICVFKLSSRQLISSIPYPTNMDPSHLLASGYAHPLTREWHSQHVKYDASHFVYPVFVLDVDGHKNEVSSMPGQYQWSVDRLTELLDPLVALGLRSVILFGVVTRQQDKSVDAQVVHSPNNPVVRTLALLKHRYPSLYLICDVCMCQYTSHGHCGLLKDHAQDPDSASYPDIDHETSIKLIADIAKNYALAGAHMVSPSDMMCGRIAAIKDMLVKEKLQRTVAVMSYSAKFASAMYGPFRDAANSKPMKGDRKGYQLPIAATGLARRALQRDVAEGADFLMVKPGGPYLDIIYIAKTETDLPVAVYQVSGEFSEILKAVAGGVFDLRARVDESIVALRRAGADIIISYFVPQLLQWFREDEVKAAQSYTLPLAKL